MAKTIKVGLVQQTCSEEKKENLKKLYDNIHDCAKKGAELVVLQELHNTPYFCQTENTDLFDLAEPIPGPSTEFYGTIGKKRRILLVTSLFELRAAGL